MGVYVLREEGDDFIKGIGVIGIVGYVLFTCVVEGLGV